MEQLLFEVVATGRVFCDKRGAKRNLMSQGWIEIGTWGRGFIMLITTALVIPATMLVKYITTLAVATESVVIVITSCKIKVGRTALTIIAH